jgi:hypothetical protein
MTGRIDKEEPGHGPHREPSETSLVRFVGRNHERGGDRAAGQVSHQQVGPTDDQPAEEDDAERRARFR